MPPVLIYFLIIATFSCGAIYFAVTARKRPFRKTLFWAFALIFLGWVLSGAYLVWLIIHNAPQ